MALSIAPAFGACPCGGAYAATLVTVNFGSTAPISHLESVPQGNCGKCGARVYKLADLERVESVMRSNRSMTGS